MTSPFKMLAIAILASLFFISACDEQDPLARSVVEGVLVKQDAVIENFSITGSVICPNCEDIEIPQGHMEIIIVPKADPSRTYAFQIYPNIGTFGFDKVPFFRAEAIEVTATVFHDNNEAFTTVPVLLGTSEIRPNQADEELKIVIEVDLASRINQQEEKDEPPTPPTNDGGIEIPEGEIRFQ